MPLLDEVSYVNYEYATALRNLTANENEYNRYINEIIPKSKLAIDDAKDILGFTEILNIQIENILESHLANKTNEFIQTVLNQVINIKHLVNVTDLEAMHSRNKFIQNEYKSQYARAKQKVASLEHLKGNNILTTIDLRNDLKHFPSINTNSISVGINDDDSPIVRWLFKDLKMQPNENPYAWLNKGQIPTIYLPDILIELNLETKKITIKNKRNDTAARKYSWDGTLRVHPHVLNNDHPCLGDWEGVIYEAIDEQDWSTIAGSLQEFLSNAANRDSAGKNWYVGAIPNWEDLKHNMSFHSNSLKVQNRDSGVYECIRVIPNPVLPKEWLVQKVDENNNYIRPARFPTSSAEIIIGSKVKLSTSSIYYDEFTHTGSNPSNIEGIVERIQHSSIYVRWPQGLNTYVKSDLNLVNSLTLNEMFPDLPRTEVLNTIETPISIGYF